jgi:hypothetical protein
MNEELLVASALFVQSVALLVSHNGFMNFFSIVQPKSQICSAPPARCTALLTL